VLLSVLTKGIDITTALWYNSAVERDKRSTGDALSDILLMQGSLSPYLAPTIHHQNQDGIGLDASITVDRYYYMEDFAVNIKGMMQDLIRDYIDDFQIDENLNRTLRQIGIDSLDQMELGYFIGDKLDLRDSIPDGFRIQQIIEYLESKAGEKTLENI
jgi:acyl carrier protein